MGTRTIVLQAEAGRFDPARYMSCTASPKEPVVLGIGFAAVRDLIAWLRFEQGAAVRSVLGLGISLSGRFAREFLELGMNADHQGRRLFDGLLITIAGAGKTFVNYEFGQPGRTRSLHGDHDFPENWFPFAYDAVCSRGDGRDPLHPGGEQLRASIGRKAPRSRIRIRKASAISPLPPNVRTYLVAGAQHAAGPSQQAGAVRARGRGTRNAPVRCCARWSARSMRG